MGCFLNPREYEKNTEMFGARIKSKKNVYEYATSHEDRYFPNNDQHKII